MSRNKIILAGIFLIVTASIFVVLQNRKGSSGLPSTPPTPAKYVSPSPIPLFEYYKPTYTADGKIDTSNWVVYRDEEDGFSARAPKGRVYVGGTDDTLKVFLYTVNNRGDFLVMNMIKKKPSSNLRNWIASYVSAYPEGITQEKFVPVGEYEALQFEIEKYSQHQHEGKLVFYKNIPYYSPNINIQEQSGSFMPNSRNYIIEATDRYLLIRYSLTENQSYIDTYNAIISSLKIFPPKKI